MAHRRLESYLVTSRQRHSSSIRLPTPVVFAVSMDIINSRFKRGRKTCDVWPYFNDDPENHRKLSGYCIHCRNMVVYHKKNEVVKKHLDRCPQFKELMNSTEASDRPEWYSAIKKAYLTSSASPFASDSASSTLPPMRQTKLNPISLSKMSKSEQQSFDINIAMHYYMSGNSAYRIEESFFLRAIKILRPDVLRPSRQRLLGELLDKCYEIIKSGVEQKIRNIDGYCTLASDGWTDIMNKSVINYNYSSPVLSVYLEGVH